MAKTASGPFETIQLTVTLKESGQVASVAGGMRVNDSKSSLKKQMSETERLSPMSSGR